MTIELVEEVDEEFDGWPASPTAVDAAPVDARPSGLRAKLRARTAKRGRTPTDPATTSEAATAAAAPSTESTLAAYEQSLRITPRVRRSDSGRWLDAHLLTVVAVAAALPALRIPATWLAVCAVVAAVFVGFASARRRGAASGTADVVVLPARAAGRLALGCLNPLNWLKVLLGAIASLVAGGVVGALVGAARWLVTEGPDGILAAARMGAWSHAARYGAAFACYLLLSGVGTTHEQRAVVLYRLTRRLREFALVGLVAVVCGAFALFALAGPGSDAGFARADDGLGWVPPGLRTVTDGVRDDAVRAELDAVTKCLSGDAKGRWTSSYTADNSLDEPDVATLVADPARAPDQPAIAAAALAAHNQLAPWVEAIRVMVGPDVVLAVDRHGLPTDAPLTDAATLRAHALGAPEWLSTVAPAVDTGQVLTCSAHTPF